MKASQYLYTSYKNSPNGGYAIYSMSSDISQEDAKVIFLLMQYPAVPMLSDTRRRLNNMTWNPVDMKDIEGVCPRNYAYFKLPSGKFCIAESGYIGPEFKGFTPSGRTGNYLIHALVVESLDKLPILYMGGSYFRHDLTLEEWTMKNPAPLPMIEVEAEGRFSQAEITSFLDADNRKEHIKKIVTALKTPGNNTPIFINDKLENARLWILAISLLLPSEEANKIYFNTYSYDDNNIKLGLPEGSKYRIQFITGSSSRMKLQQKLMTGIVVDIPNNQYTQNLPLDDIINTEVEYLYKDIFSAVPFLTTIERIKSTYGVDNHMAVLINDLEKNGIEGKNANELLELLTIYSKGNNFSNFVLPTFNHIIDGTYMDDNDTLNLARFLYPYLSNDNKVKYVHFIFDPYLAKVGYDENLFISETKNKYNFIYKEFAHLYPINKEGKELLLNNQDNRALVGLYLDSLLSDVIYNLNNDYKDLGEVMMSLCKSAFDKGDIAYALSLVSKVSQYLPTLKSDLYKDAIEKTDIKQYNIYLPYLKEVNDINYVANRLYKMIMQNNNKKEVLTLYRSFIASKPDYSKIDVTLSAREDVKAIIEIVEKEDFINLASYNNEILNNYYKKYYLTNNDKDGAFVKAFNRYFNTVNDANNIIYWINVFSVNKLKEEDAAIYSLLLNKLMTVSLNNYGRYRNEFNTLKRLGAVSSEVEVKMFADELFAKKDIMLRQDIATKRMYANIFNGIDEENRKRIFASKYLIPLVGTLIRSKTTSHYEDAGLLNELCLPFTTLEVLLNDLYSLERREKIDVEKYLVILYLAAKRNEAFSPIAQKIYQKRMSLLTPKDKKNLSKYIMKEIKVVNEGQGFNFIKALDNELNGVANQPVQPQAQPVQPQSGQPFKPEPAPRPTNVPPVNNNSGTIPGSNTSGTANVNNTQNKTENMEQETEKKGFFHGLFHKKK